MVRLKAGIFNNLIDTTSKFQFQNGAIKSNFNFIFLKFQKSFNSKMVRLKDVKEVSKN